MNDFLIPESQDASYFPNITAKLIHMTIYVWAAKMSLLIIKSNNNTATKVNTGKEVVELNVLR